MTSGSFGGDLMAGPPPTHLPADPADAELAGGDAPAAVVRRHPASPVAWAALAQQAVDAGADDVTVYAYARVGYHRSPSLRSPRGRSGRPRSGSAARPSCATPAPRRPTSCSAEPGRPREHALTVLGQVRRYLLTVAGPVRSPAHNVQLAALLALNAGVLNSVGFVAVSVYTSHMTGLTASVADHLVLGGSAIVLTGLLGIATFMAGAAACAVLFNWGRRRGLRGRYANVLVLEALLVLLFGLLAEEFAWRHRDLVFVAVLCFTMGMQNAIITKISGAQIRTTHVTGMVTDIGIELGKLAYVSRTPGLPPVVPDLRKLGVLALLVGLFFAGGILGALGYLEFGFATLVPLALVLLAAAAAPLAADVRRHRRTPRRA